MTEIRTTGRNNNDSKRKYIIAAVVVALLIIAAVVYWSANHDGDSTTAPNAGSTPATNAPAGTTNTTNP